MDSTELHKFLFPAPVDMSGLSTPLTLLDPWEFIKEFPTAEKLHAALQEVSTQVKDVFAAHEQVAANKKAAEDARIHTKDSVNHLKSELVKSNRPSAQVWLEGLEELLHAMDGIYAKQIDDLESQRQALQCKIDAFTIIISGMKKQVEGSVSSSIECCVCYKNAVKLAYNCGHCICQSCHNAKRSFVCHMCSAPIVSTTKLFIN
jgi:uncharacterized protein YhaN